MVRARPDRRNSLLGAPLRAARALGEEDEEGKAANDRAAAAAVAWRDLPRKDQLLVITLARLSEPLTQTSLQAYMFYQLKWFDGSLTDDVISRQAGILMASFTFTQFLTAMMWGRIADSKYFGRKSVLMIGLTGTCISCLGFGLAKTFWQALAFRLLGGVTNGNVGVLRTMISEIIREKKYQSRAFLLLPMTFNIGVIIGPMLGGLLSDPAGSYPNLFGNNAFFKEYPYALPNIMSAIFLMSAVLLVWLRLEETLDTCNDGKPDIGLKIGRQISILFSRCLSRKPYEEIAYMPLQEDDENDDPLPTPLPVIELSDTGTPGRNQANRHRVRFTRRLPFRRIFTRNVVFTFLSHFFLAFHIGTLNSIWFVFLSTPVYDPAHPPPSLPNGPRLPFRFTGGLGLPPRSVGMAMSILGFVGIPLQIFLYPVVSARLGTVRALRLFMCIFPIIYFIVPYLSMVPSTSPAPNPKSGPAMWCAIAAFLALYGLGRTFVLPSQTILVNNCTPHPSVLATVHGLGQSASSASRTIGPVIAGWLYGVGLTHGVVGAAWWFLCGISVVCLIVSAWIWEGDGHEIWLEGDEEDT